MWLFPRVSIRPDYILKVHILFSQYWPTKLWCAVVFSLLLDVGWWVVGRWLGWLARRTGQRGFVKRLIAIWKATFKALQPIQGLLLMLPLLCSGFIAFGSIAVAPHNTHITAIKPRKAPSAASTCWGASVWAWRLQLRNFILKHLISNVQPFPADWGLD